MITGIVGQHGEQIGTFVFMLIDQNLHPDRYLDTDLDACFVAVIDDFVSVDILLFQVYDVDKGHPVSHETEK